MGFHELIEKVQQAETALEARERQAAADWRQTKATWRSMWTPGRIVIVGCTVRLRETSWSPARDAFCCVDSRIACTKSLSPGKVRFDPTPRSVDIAAPLSSDHV